MRRPRKELVKPCEPLNAASLKVLELQIAKEILAETFGISIPEVEEMIRNHVEDASSQECRQEEDGYGRRSSGGRMRLRLLLALVLIHLFGISSDHAIFLQKNGSIMLRTKFGLYQGLSGNLSHKLAYK